MRVLVTGGAGFIGAHVVRRLGSRGYGVTILDDLTLGSKASVPAWAKLVIGDIRDADAVRRAGEGCDAVVHLAAVASVLRSVQEPEFTRSVNLDGAAVVAEWAGEKGARSVLASSAAVYGDADRVPISEDAPYAPRSPYAEHKALAEGLFTATGDAAILRFFNVYGPGQDPRSDYAGVISLFARRVADGDPLIINGDGGHVRDFIYVGDVARAVSMALERPESGALTLNIATGEAVRIDGLARAIARVAGVAPEIRYAPERAGDIHTSLADVRRAKEILGFSARIGLDEGLQALLRPSEEEDA